MSGLVAALDPRGFLGQYVKQGIRQDSRTLSEARALSISANPFVATGDAGPVVVGSSMVQMGATRMCCSVTLQVGTPSAMSPDRGDFDMDVTLGALCSASYDQRGKPDDAYELEMLLETVLKRKCAILDLGELCIEPEKSAFQLNVSIICLSADGNIQDAALLAAVAALQNTSLPEAVADSTTGQVRISRDASKSRFLPLRCLPVPVTVGLVSGELLLDPTLSEQQGLDGLLRCVVLEDGSLCHMAQSDFTGEGLTMADLGRAVEFCRKAAGEVRSTLGRARAR